MAVYPVLPVENPESDSQTSVPNQAVIEHDFSKEKSPDSPPINRPLGDECLHCDSDLRYGGFPLQLDAEIREKNEQETALRRMTKKYRGEP